MKPNASLCLCVCVCPLTIEVSQKPPRAAHSYSLTPRHTKHPSHTPLRPPAHATEVPIWDAISLRASSRSCLICSGRWCSLGIGRVR